MTYTNSPLATVKILSDKHSNRTHKIDTITIHCFVGQVTAKQGLEFFKKTQRKSSTNYVVGFDGSIGLCVEEKYRAWTTGGTLKANGMTGSQNDHRAVTIEVASDTTHPYAVTDAAYSALIELVADIAHRNGIKELKWKADKNLVGVVSKQNMTVHRWFANKACCGDYLFYRHYDIAAKANERLKEMDYEVFCAFMNRYLDEQRRKPVSPWAAESVEKAKAKGIMKGDENGNIMPQSPVTRQEWCVLADRLGEL